jgi:hypothetical protein
MRNHALKNFDPNVERRRLPIMEKKTRHVNHHHRHPVVVHHHNNNDEILIFARMIIITVVAMMIIMDVHLMTLGRLGTITISTRTTNNHNRVTKISTTKTRTIINNHATKSEGDIAINVINDSDMNQSVEEVEQLIMHLKWVNMVQVVVVGVVRAAETVENNIC